MFKQQSWKPYGRKAVSLDINIKDQNEQTLDFVKLQKGKDIDNERMLKRVRKHGFNLKEVVEDKEPEEVTEEKNWLEKDLEW